MTTAGRRGGNVEAAPSTGAPKGGQASAEAPESLDKFRQMLCCPRCQGELAFSEVQATCASCGQTFPVDDGIPLLFWPTEGDADSDALTAQVRSFYEETPFPNYDEFDSVSSLIEKARRGVFAKLLDEQVPFGSCVLECGCGTAQLSNFLGVAHRTVFGTDLCLNSLRLGQQFRDANGLRRVHLLQMNLFRPVFRPGTFDIVISNGVLHHTPDPFGGFKTISELVRPGGYVVIGLYHKYGRLITNTRRLIFRYTKDRFTSLDPNLRAMHTSDAKKRAWFMDQYKHPHESQHTIGETLKWLPKLGLEFVRSIPGTIPFKPFSERENLFRPEPPGGPLQRLMVELGMAFKGSREGGFFIIIARKPGGQSNGGQGSAQKLA
jgi:SAM-dependent methyltransferase